jgi:hypothetical protein
MEETNLNVQLRESHQKSVAQSDNQTASVKARDGIRSHHHHIGDIDQDN